MFQWICRSWWTTCCWLAAIQSPSVMADGPDALRSSSCRCSAASRSQRYVAVPSGFEQRGHWPELATTFSRLSRPDPGAWQLAGARVWAAARLAASRLPRKGVVSAHGPAAGRLGGQAGLAAPGWDEQHGRRLRQRRHAGSVDGFITPYEFDVTEHSRPGTENTIACCVDSTGPCPGGDVQFRGALGRPLSRVYLEARSDPAIDDVFVIPDVKNQMARVQVTLRRQTTDGPWQGGIGSAHCAGQRRQQCREPRDVIAWLWAGRRATRP